MLSLLGLILAAIVFYRLLVGWPEDDEPETRYIIVIVNGDDEDE